MGVVYKARHEKLKRIVAIKLVLSGQLASEQDVERFHAEARAGAHLDHPGIVPIFEVGQHAGQHYLSMSYVEGQSLAERVSAGPLPSQEAAEIVCQVAQAVAYAHGQGVIHRDLKPANIMLDERGRPRVTDFGLAKRVSVSESDAPGGVTVTGQILGTPSFMPPEQAAGNLHDVGPESDVYALGAVLYNLIAGRPPFQAANPIDTVLQVLNQEPVAPRKLNPQVPRDLETICLKCLEKDRSRRYESAEALVGDLRRYVAGQPIQARPVGAANRLWRWACRHRAAAALLVLVAVLVAGFAVGMPTAYSIRNALLQQTVVALGKAEAEALRSRRADARPERYLPSTGGRQRIKSPHKAKRSARSKPKRRPWPKRNARGNVPRRRPSGRRSNEHVRRRHHENAS